jgi:hypothetical protein
MAGLPAMQSRVQRLGGTPHLCPFDGDKSPAKSADKSAHSKALWLQLCRASSGEQQREETTTTLWRARLRWAGLSRRLTLH